MNNKMTLAESLARWRATLRIGRRVAWRSPTRTMAAALLTGLPVAVVFAVLGVQWTLASPERVVANWLGSDSAVQASVLYSGSPSVAQNTLGLTGSVGDDFQWGAVPIEKLEQWLPEGDTLVAIDMLFAASVSLPGVLDTSDPAPEPPVGEEGQGSTILGPTQVSPPMTVEGAVGGVAVWQTPSASLPLMGDGSHKSARITPGPGEALVSDDVLSLIGATVGESVRITAPLESADGRSALIDATVLVVGSLNGQGAAMVGAGTYDYDRTRDWNLSHSSWFVFGSTPVTWDDVKAINAHGFQVVSRDVIANPPPADQLYPGEDEQIPSVFSIVRAQPSWLVVLLGMAIVADIVLLVSPIFSMAQRRDVRMLAMVAASGGTSRDLYRVMLAYGIVVGTLAALFAVLMGSGIGMFVSVVIMGTGFFLMPAAILPLTIITCVLLGVLASVWPAEFAARIDVIAALSNRPTSGPIFTIRRRKVLPFMLIIGLVAQVICAMNGYVGGIVIAVALTFAAMMASMTWMVPAFGELVNRGTLPWRLALSDALRQGHRTIPAVAAIVAAVFTVTGALVIVTSTDEASWQTQAHIGPRGQVFVSAADVGATEEQQVALQRRAASVVAARNGELSRLTVWGMSYNSGQFGALVEVRADIPSTMACPLDRDGVLEEASDGAAQLLASHRDDPRCWQWFTAPPTFDAITANLVIPAYIVDDGSYLARTGLFTPEELVRAAGVLQRGGVLVPDPRALQDGRATLRSLDMTHSHFVSHDGDSGARPEAERLVTASFEARVWQALDIIVLSPQAAQELQAPALPLGTLIQTSTSINRFTADRFSAHIESEVPGISAVVIQPSGQTMIVPYIYVLLALMIAIGTVSTVVVLASEDSRAALDTLDAVGAPPFVRRRVAVCQALVLMMYSLPMGAAMGILSGVLVVYARIHEAAQTGMIVISPVVPWGPISLFVIALIILSAIAGLMSSPIRTKARLRIE